MTFGLGRSAMLTAALLLAACASSPTSVSGGVPRLLADARAAFEKQEWSRTRDLAESVVEVADLGADREEASFLRAASNRRLGHYDTSYTQLKRFVEDYPISRWLPSVQKELFELGVELMNGAGGGFLGIPRALGMALEGPDVLHYLRQVSPNSASAQNALRLIAQYYFEHGEYDRAEVEYQTLIEDHPGGIWQPLAEYRVALCKLRYSRGAAYDRRLLEAALKGFESYEQKHPDGDYVDQAREHAKEVHELLAEKSYRTGMFYLANLRREAGVFYLKATVQDYPETEWAGYAIDGLRDVMADYPGTDAARSAAETVEVHAK